jgi:DNA repair protein RecO (recombination protein O)
MTPKQSYKTDHILLRSIPYGESDRIVTFFTQEYGKVKGMAKGARRSRKRFVNALENFSCGQLMFSRKNREGLAWIEACDVRNHFPGIRADMDKTLTASYFIELVDAFTLEGKKNEGLFSLLLDFLHHLDGGSSSEGLVRIFELRLLKHLGYEPVLDRCVGCRTRLEEMGRIFFDPLEGGIRCGACAPPTRNLYSMMQGTVKTLLLGKETETARLHRLVFSGAALMESRKALTAFIHHLLGKELRSLNVLNEIKRMAI